MSEERQRSAGQAAKWTLSVAPCLVYSFAIRVSGQDEATIELSKTLGPAEEAEIVSSGFIPLAPTGFTSDNMATMATLKWDASACAERTELNYAEVGTGDYQYVEVEEGEVQVNDLKPCTSYEVIIAFKIFWVACGTDEARRNLEK